MTRVRRLRNFTDTSACDAPDLISSNDLCDPPSIGLGPKSTVSVRRLRRRLLNKCPLQQIEQNALEKNSQSAMNLLNHLWDDTVAGPPPDDGGDLGKLRKFSTFSSRPDSRNESENPNQRSLTVDTTDGGLKVTRSIKILKSPRNQSKDSPPSSLSPSPAGSTPPVSPFSFSGKDEGVCISPGGRFPRFSNEGKPPRKVNKGPRDLNLCRVFRWRTCCDISQTHPTLLSIRRLASAGEASQECLHLWELLECSICDPYVGVQPGPPLICASLCDRVYQACSNAYFAVDPKTQVLAPCGGNDFVCGRASEWISNGTELCIIAGFKPAYDDPEEVTCYGGKSSRDSISKSWGTSNSKFTQTADSSSTVEGFKHWVEDILFSERVSWAIGGMVLTAGLLFVSQRRSRRQRCKQAAIKRTVKKLNPGSQAREARRQVEDR